MDHSKIILQYRHKDLNIDVTMHSEMLCGELLDQMCAFMIAIGYHPESVKRCVMEKAEEYEECDRIVEDFERTLMDGLDEDDV